MEYHEVKINLDLLIGNVVRVIVQRVWFLFMSYHDLRSSRGAYIVFLEQKEQLRKPAMLVSSDF